MNLNYFLICDAADLTQAGKPILFGVFDKIFLSTAPTQEKPGVHAYMALAYQIENFDRSVEHELLIEFKHVETGTVVASQSAQSPVEGNNKRFGGISPIPMMPLPFLGLYTFTLIIDGEKLGHTNLEVSHRG